MSAFSWRLPAPPVPVAAPGSAAATLQAQARTTFGGMLDQLIDPVTLDYVDADDGSWVETADSRSIMMCQIELRLGEDIYAPEDGTRVKAFLETGDPVTPEIAIAETLRAANLLVTAGIVSDVQASSGFDETGRFTITMAWRDLASGMPVDLVYVPFVQQAA
jgi:hypothetical protein